MNNKQKNELHSLIESTIAKALNESESICLDSSMDKEWLRIKLENQILSALDQFISNGK